MLPPMEDKRSFQIEEYRALRKEIDQHMIESRAEERYAIIAAGITWGWLIFNHKTNGLLWAVPVLLTAAIVFRTEAMSKHIHEIGQYLKTLEEAFQAPGWEHKKIPRNVTRINRVITIGFLVLAVIAWLWRKTLAG
jgi:hypothetical protein